MIAGEHVMHRMPSTDPNRLVVVRRRDDDQVVDKAQVFGQRRGEEIPIADADCHRFDSHNTRLPPFHITPDITPLTAVAPLCPVGSCSLV